MPIRMPTIFAAGGGPDHTDDAAWMGALSAWGASIPRPTSILAFSAHWETRPLAIGATSTPVPLVYDFGGFPERYYKVTWPAPGAPALADRLRALLTDARVPFVDAPRRGLDHGVYPALKGLFPNADVPTLPVSLPSDDPRALFAFGKTLAPLRDEGVLIVASGFLIHNLDVMMRDASRARGASFGDALGSLRGVTDAPPWARAFDAWVEDVVTRKDWDALVDYRARAPHVDVALPTHEHFLPLLIAAGAGADGPVRFPISGFAYATATKRSVQLG